MAGQPIIIKRKAAHGGHHGGAWKVAYADFVTAMMALFIVLWLMNSSKQIQDAVGGYFRDPKGTASKDRDEPERRGRKFHPRQGGYVQAERAVGKRDPAQPPTLRN